VNLCTVCADRSDVRDFVSSLSGLEKRRPYSFQTGGGIFGEAKRLRTEAKCFHLARYECPGLSSIEDYANFDSRRMMSGWSQRIIGHALAVRFIAVPSIWRSRGEIASFECAVCNQTMEAWNTAWVPIYRFVAGPVRLSNQE